MTWHPDMPDEYKNQIVTGDARVLAERIPDESVDLIFTDPVYDRIDDYRWLAETAARVLKPDGQVFVYQAHKYLPLTFQALESLVYVWTLAENTANFNARYWPLHLFINWRPLLWYAKAAPRKCNSLTPDMIRITSDRGHNHKWHKYEGAILRWLGVMTVDTGTVFDPFSGGGTIPAVCKMLSRNYIAFEIDPATADLARERVANTQPPLFVPEPEQLSLDLEADR